MFSFTKTLNFIFPVWDASGHYSGGYFWGNQYWMGSRTLCREIAESESDLPFAVEFSVARTNLTVKLHAFRKVVCLILVN